ncbi:NACHT domain-containing protein [Acinetobacter baumannii]
MVIELSTGALKSVAPTIIKEVSNYIKKKYEGYKVLNTLSESNGELVLSISKLMSVKTLLTGADSPVNLFDFFQQPQLKYKKENFCITHIDEVKEKVGLDSNTIVLKGTVGQGKSIFLRSLAIQDFIENKRIPIFIELKNISRNKELIKLMRDYLSPWIGDSEEAFKLVLKSGKVSVFLDAFDEIDLDLYQETYASIDNLVKNYPELKVIITSRPETIILESPNFYTISLCPYDFKEQKGLIEKIVEDKDNQHTLIESIRLSSFEVKSVLKTPLMVILYIKQYTFGFSVPQHVSDFYKNIFDVVTFTHDKSKGIEKRKSFSSLNQDQLEKVFARFCFETFLIGKTVFDKSLFIEILKKSLEKNFMSTDIDYTDLINDYTRFACLILKDGSHYTFIHKSIQEYYVANFISNLPEASAKEVIEIKFVKKKSFLSFINTNYIDFLEILKPYYFKKYYLSSGLKVYQKDFNLEFNNDNENFQKFLETIYVVTEPQEDEGTHFAIKYGTATVFFQLFNDSIRDGFNYAYENNLVETESILLASQDLIDNTDADQASKIKKVIDIFDDEKFFLEMRKVWVEVCKQVKELIQQIVEIETSVLDGDLDI